MRIKAIRDAGRLMGKLGAGLAVGIIMLMAGRADAACAADPAFNMAQRAEIVRIVRQALKDDPTILVEAVQSLRDKGAEDRKGETARILRAHWVALSDTPDFAVRGNPKGSLTVIEFLDPRCGYCRKMLPVVRDWLARDHDVRFIERLIPILGDSSLVGTQAVLAAGEQGQYGAMRDLCMTSSVLNEETVLRFAERLNLDVARFKRDMESDKIKKLVKRNLELAQTIRLQGTPYFIFGRKVVAPGAFDASILAQYAAAARA